MFSLSYENRCENLPNANIIVSIGCFQKLVEIGTHKFPPSLCHRSRQTYNKLRRFRLCVHKSMDTHYESAWRHIPMIKEGVVNVKYKQLLPLPPWVHFFHLKIVFAFYDSIKNINFFVYLIISHSLLNFLQVQLSVLYCNLDMSLLRRL